MLCSQNSDCRTLIVQCCPITLSIVSPTAFQILLDRTKFYQTNFSNKAYCSNMFGFTSNFLAMHIVFLKSLNIDKKKSDPSKKCFKCIKKTARWSIGLVVYFLFTKLDIFMVRNLAGNFCRRFGSSFCLFFVRHSLKRFRLSDKSDIFDSTDFITHIHHHLTLFVKAVLPQYTDECQVSIHLSEVQYCPLLSPTPWPPPPPHTHISIITLPCLSKLSSLSIQTSARYLFTSLRYSIVHYSVRPPPPPLPPLPPPPPHTHIYHHLTLFVKAVLPQYTDKCQVSIDFSKVKYCPII